jgi:hypothetical protein
MISGKGSSQWRKCFPKYEQHTVSFVAYRDGGDSVAESGGDEEKAGAAASRVLRCNSGPDSGFQPRI